MRIKKAVETKICATGRVVEDCGGPAYTVVLRPRGRCQRIPAAVGHDVWSEPKIAYILDEINSFFVRIPIFLTC
jgi:hypothetical protein